MRLMIDWSPAITLSDTQVKYLRYGGVEFTPNNAFAFNGAVITNPAIIGRFQAAYDATAGNIPVSKVSEILLDEADKFEKEINKPRPHLMLNQPEEIDIEL